MEPHGPVGFRNFRSLASASLTCDGPEGPTAPPAGRRPLFREQSRRVEAWSGGPEGGLQTAFGEGGWVCKAGICETLLMPLLPGLQLLAREDEVFSSLPSP